MVKSILPGLSCACLSFILTSSRSVLSSSGELRQQMLYEQGGVSGATCRRRGINPSYTLKQLMMKEIGLLGSRGSQNVSNGWKAATSHPYIINRYDARLLMRLRDKFFCGEFMYSNSLGICPPTVMLHFNSSTWITPDLSTLSFYPCSADLNDLLSDTRTLTTAVGAMGTEIWLLAWKRQNLQFFFIREVSVKWCTCIASWELMCSISRTKVHDTNLHSQRWINSTWLR